MKAKTDALDACPQCGSQVKCAFSNPLCNDIRHHSWHDSAPEPGAPMSVPCAMCGSNMQREELGWYCNSCQPRRWSPPAPPTIDHDNDSLPEPTSVAAKLEKVRAELAEARKEKP
jgi:hypothetical protein